jgi:hypothetical protein
MRLTPKAKGSSRSGREPLSFKETVRVPACLSRHPDSALHIVDRVIGGQSLTTGEVKCRSFIHLERFGERERTVRSDGLGATRTN